MTRANQKSSPADDSSAGDGTGSETAEQTAAAGRTDAPASEGGRGATAASEPAPVKGAEKKAATKTGKPKTGKPKTGASTKLTAVPDRRMASEENVNAFIDALTRWGLRLAAVAAVVYGLIWLFGVGVHVEVTRLWYGSVHAGSVYGTILGTEVLLFVIFGGLAAIAGFASAWFVVRSKPLPDDEAESLTGIREWTRRHPRLSRVALLVLGTVLPMVSIGSNAASQWQTWLLWSHAQPWGSTDPTYHRDLSYYLEVYPQHRLVVNLLGSVVYDAFLVALVAALVHGAVRFFGSGRGISRRLVAQISVIGVFYLLVHAAGLWLDRAASVVSQRSIVTGASYTDLNAVDPGKLVLIVVTVAVAGLLAWNGRRARLRFLALGLAIMIVAGAIIGSAWPALVMQYRERPSAASLEIPLIQRNQAATAKAFGLQNNIATVPYNPKTTLSGSALKAQVARNAQLRLLDPNRLSPTFNVKQQLQAYYGFKGTLDVDRYPLPGSSKTGGSSGLTDVAIAARELYPAKAALQSWANSHLVYTHGYGVVAAQTDSLNSGSDVPNFIDAGAPPSQQIPLKQPDIYFGQSPMPWAIVGEPKGATRHTEFDHPAGSGSDKAAYTTYTGDGGVPVGSFFRRVLYAASLHSSNILFSGQINSGSRILTVRNPKARVAAVAPWLTLDGDVYPTVVNGQVEWVVDGYTTSSTYPGSQLVNLHGATTSTLTAQGSNSAQGNRTVNYLHNSVKAVVNAYTGQVTLYEWNQAQQPDPLLKAWESVFPGLVKPQSAIPPALVQHLRYPQDLFDVQRSLLTRYHVSSASDFYSGNDFWAVPNDPTVAATQQLNSGATSGPLAVSAGHGTPTLPSVYMSQSATGFGQQRFSLSSPLVTLNRRDLAAYLSVDAQPGPDYGKMTLLEFPPGGTAGSPGEVQNQIESTTKISEALTLQRGGNSRVVLGNLLSVPLGGRMLYVEPIYTQAQGGASYPILRHVVALYGGGSPAFTTTLGSALKQALASGTAAPGQ